MRHSQDTKRKRREDDGESADNDSILSTSSNLEPFANDNLGECVRCSTSLALEHVGLHAHYNTFSFALPCNFKLFFLKL